MENNCVTKERGVKWRAWLIIIFFLVGAPLLIPLGGRDAPARLEKWVARYNGPGNGADEPSAIAVDGSGNIYVTGWSRCAGPYDDYATIKYNPSGKQLWAKRYNGAANGDDKASAIAVDRSGNVYVTGSSKVSSIYLFDYATVKYNANGRQIWVAKYAGPDNLSDAATAIAVDSSGNIYVTGWSEGSSTYYDFATVKYNTKSKQLWVARYNGPGNLYDEAYAIAVDRTGSVYVTGQSLSPGTDYDYATIKYDSSGKQLWVARYNGPGNSWDKANAIAVDGVGNVYVTGFSQNSGSGQNLDYATIKYNRNGKQLWVKRYNGPGNSDDQANAIATDALGNIYVTGRSYGSGTSYDYATIKYSPSGNRLWLKRFNSSGKSDDQARAMAMDRSGNIYITGRSKGSDFGATYDYATIMYNTNGKQIRVERYNGSPGSDDEACAIVVDGSGNVYVTGRSYAGFTLFDYITVKY
jgi:uncharacterized delta-60 repeat protein